MEIKLNNKIHSNKLPYTGYLESIEDIKKLATYMYECGFGYWNSDELFDLWNEISEKYSACWLNVPNTVEEFKEYLSSVDIGYVDDEEE